MMKKIIASSAVFATVLLTPAMALAHVVVTPAEAGIGKHQLFTMSVPNEHQLAVTNLMLKIPSGVTDVTPTTKDGWTITPTSQGSAVTGLTWSGGSIPIGQRQDFSFSAVLPAKATELHWNAYQTYADGTVVSWDQSPTAAHADDEGSKGPYSVTKVVDDLTTKSSDSNSSVALILSILALVISFSTLFRKKK